MGRTRDRWTLNTHVLLVPRGPEGHPPLEALFKGGPRVVARSQAALDRLREEGDYGPLAWLSVAVGPRGSYRQEHVLKYLERNLPLLTLERPWKIPLVRRMRFAHG